MARLCLRSSSGLETEAGEEEEEVGKKEHRKFWGVARERERRVVCL